MHPSRLGIIVAILLTSPALARAELRFTQPAVDLGQLRGGPAYQHRFDFINDSAQSIEILDIRLGCGCLQPVLDKRTFQPGEKGSLLMHLRTLGQANGMRTWQAHVQYRHGDTIHEIGLILAATLRNEVTIEPSILAMAVETSLRQVVTITDHRPTAMKIGEVSASSPAVRVTKESSGNGITRVILEVNRADLTTARQEVMLNIPTDDPYYRQLQVPITLMQASRPNVTATPDKVELASGSRLVRLRALGDQVVRIEGAEADHPALRTTWASGPGNDVTLKISVDAAKRTTARTAASVRIRIAEPTATTLTIPVEIRQD